MVRTTTNLSDDFRAVIGCGRGVVLLSLESLRSLARPRTASELRSCHRDRTGLWPWRADLSDAITEASRGWWVSLLTVLQTCTEHRRARERR